MVRRELSMKNKQDLIQTQPKEEVKVNELAFDLLKILSNTKKLYNQSEIGRKKVQIKKGEKLEKF